MKIHFIPNTLKILALAAVISLTSCKKDVTDVTNPNSGNSGAANLSDSSTAADNMYYDVLNNAFVSYSDNTGKMSSSGSRSGQTTTFSTEAVNGTETHMGCAIYSLDDTIPNNYPKTLTADFGSGCTSADGIFRKGKLTYVFSGPIYFPGATVSVTFSQYVVNGYGLQGSYLITNNSTGSGDLVINTKVTNGIITYPNATNYHYSHNKTFTLISGMDTPLDITDDVYNISGNCAFSDAAGNSLVFNVTTPLVKAISCHNISQGVLSFSYNQSINGTIDFGDGTCDNLATVTVGDIHRTIILR
jgi:hypothetical protein